VHFVPSLGVGYFRFDSELEVLKFGGRGKFVADIIGHSAGGWVMMHGT
jgi:hypothetical protein